LVFEIRVLILVAINYCRVINEKVSPMNNLRATGGLSFSNGSTTITNPSVTDLYEKLDSAIYPKHAKTSPCLDNFLARITGIIVLTLMLSTSYAQKKQDYNKPTRSYPNELVGLSSPMSYVFEGSEDELIRLQSISNDLVIFSVHTRDFLLANPNTLISIVDHGEIYEVDYAVVYDNPSSVDVRRRMSYLIRSQNRQKNIDRNKVRPARVEPTNPNKR